MDSRIWKVIVAVAALHVLVLGSMFLIQHGCKKTPTPDVAKAEPAGPIIPSAPSAPPPGGVGQLPSSAYPPPGPVAPPVTAEPPVPPAPQVKTYTIKKGDTLGQIAKLEGVNVSDLTTANPGLDAKKLKVGQEIHIPAAGGAATGEAGHVAPSVPSTSKAGATSGTYVVKKGDTLAKIAKSQGTTVTALKKANNLSSDVVRIGQKLKIPTPHESGQRPPREAKTVAKKETTSGTVVEASGTTHIVQTGETPAVIAKKYGVSTKALLTANGNLDPKKLRVGQKLTIPGKAGEAAPTAPEAAPAAPAAPEAGTPAAPAAPDASTGSVSGAAVAPPTATPAETMAPPAQAPAAPPAPAQK